MMCAKHCIYKDPGKTILNVFVKTLLWSLTSPPLKQMFILINYSKLSSMTPPRCSHTSLPRRNGNGNPNSNLFSLVLFLLVSVLRTQSAHAYANWLKCYIEFDDKEEVVMHHPIVHTEDQSEERKAYIEIQPYTSRRKAPWMASMQQEHEDLFLSSIYNATTATTLLKLRLRVPPSLPQKGVQFVVEAIGEGVSFVGQGVMCDGTRAFSKQHVKHVLLQINSTRTYTGKNEPENLDERSALLSDIELVAGWAAGYGAVKLTPKMILRRSSLGKTTANRSATNDYDLASSSSDQQNDGDIGDEL